ncbi:oligopeptide ABC transporter permease [Nakamurella lactea]|jgi:peptide/nickel transport system permease protein|uniref:oligopeptide ABC transporter permease n=1 Tax=Nakamurella lactea TaxID=459515 RepID=UPI0004051B34|nr:oligopeptide ABC transporter permease [Nakamurella lactea]
MTATFDPNLPAAAPAADHSHDAAEGLAAVRRSPSRMALRRYMSNRLAVAGAVVLVVLVLGVLLLPVFMHLDPYTVDPLNVRAKPTGDHLLGTDGVGRDVFARLVYGGRISMLIGFSAALLAVLIGSLIGALAGTLGGWVDSTFMRMADVFMSFPNLVAIIVVVGIFGANVIVMVILLALFGWTQTARVVRGMILSLREREYVQASRAFGAKPLWLISRHLLPAALSQVVVLMTLEVAGFILSEAALSFLGVGIQPPTASWGNMLQAAQQYTVISSMPWLWLPPGLAIALTVLAINFVGDGLRDALDPRQR